MEKRAVTYIRVSDPSQLENNSLETQRKICIEYAKSKQYEIIEEFNEEAGSAKHVYTRDKLTELLRYCSNKKNQISYVIVYKMDRFSRNVAEGLDLITRLATCGVFVCSATEQFSTDAAGNFLKNVLMAAAQYDNETKGEKVNDNMQSVYRDGLWPFKCPIGYMRKFKTKEENKGLPVLKHPTLAPLISEMFLNASKGIYTMSQLARMLNTNGFADHYRVAADHKIVRGILSKSFYYGRMYAKKWDEYVIGRHEPITDEPTWQKAYHYLILKKKNYHYQDVELYPLKGSLRCELCNNPMTTSPSRGNTTLVNYYECKQKGCSKLRINAKIAHSQFEKLLQEMRPSIITITLFENMVFSAWDKVISQSKAQIETYDKKILTFQDELISIRKAKDDEIYSPDEARSEAEKVRQAMAIAKIERADICIEQYDNEIIREFTKQFLTNLPLLWDNLDLPKRQAFLDKVFNGAIICTKNKTIRTFELSPTFELIRSLAAENSENVTL